MLESRSQQVSGRRLSIPLLFPIDLPRSPAVWLVVPLLVAAYVLGRDAQPKGLVLWTITSATSGMVPVILSPVVAGFMTWVGQADRRHLVLHLIRSLPTRGVAHHLSVLLASVFWIGVAGLGYLGWQTYLLVRHATYGGLELEPILMGTSVIVAAAAIGFALGLVSDRFWMPFAMAAGFAVFQIGLPLVVGSSLRFLSAVPFLGSRSGGVLADYWGAVSAPFVAWTLGLAATTLLLAILSIVRKPWLVAGAGVAAAITLFGGATLVALPSDFYAIPREEKPWQPECAAAERVNLTVCVHPAYTANLGTTLDVATQVWEPVADLGGIPERIDQFVPDPNVVPLPIHFASNGREFLAVEYAGVATDGYATVPQAVAALWLASQAVPLDDDVVFEIAVRLVVSGEADGADGGADLQAVAAMLLDEAERLDALPAEDRAQWLATNWDALRAGELGTEDLPVA